MAQSRRSQKYSSMKQASYPDRKEAKRRTADRTTTEKILPFDLMDDNAIAYDSWVERCLQVERDYADD